MCIRERTDNLFKQTIFIVSLNYNIIILSENFNKEFTFFTDLIVYFIYQWNISRWAV